MQSKYLPINYWDAQEIEINIEQLTWIKDEHSYLENALRPYQYIWKKTTILFGKNVNFRSAIKELQQQNKNTPK